MLHGIVIAIQNILFVYLIFNVQKYKPHLKQDDQ